MDRRTPGPFPERETGAVRRTRDVPPTTWRNGAGITREIATRGVPGATTGFEWRISVADLTRSTSFSRFPGIDRTFVVASRTGVVLAVDGATSSLGQGDALAFPGEADVGVSLPGGPATALNLMTTRDWDGAARVVEGEGEQTFPPCTVAVLILAGRATTSRGEALEPMDFFLCGTEGGTLHLTQARAVLIDVRPRDRTGR